MFSRRSKTNSGLLMALIIWPWMNFQHIWVVVWFHLPTQLINWNTFSVQIHTCIITVSEVFLHWGGLQKLVNIFVSMTKRMNQDAIHLSMTKCTKLKTLFIIWTPLSQNITCFLSLRQLMKVLWKQNVAWAKYNIIRTSQRAGVWRSGAGVTVKIPHHVTYFGLNHTWGRNIQMFPTMVYIMMWCTDYVLIWKGQMSNCTLITSTIRWLWSRISRGMAFGLRARSAPIELDFIQMSKNLPNLWEVNIKCTKIRKTQIWPAVYGRTQNQLGMLL